MAYRLDTVRAWQGSQKSDVACSQQDRLCVVGRQTYEMDYQSKTYRIVIRTYTARSGKSGGAVKKVRNRRKKVARALAR